jgi:hypothetical protein
VFWLCTKVGDPGDVVIEKQQRAIFDKRAPAIATRFATHYYLIDEPISGVFQT